MDVFANTKLPWKTTDPAAARAVHTYTYLTYLQIHAESYTYLSCMQIHADTHTYLSYMQIYADTHTYLNIQTQIKTWINNVPVLYYSCST